jgi:peptide/nickel transport system permease protein
MWIRSFLKNLLRLLLTVVLGGFLGATLVRLAPGFGVDDQELDSRLNEQSLQALRESRASERNIARYYVHYLGGLVHGDFGFSRSLGRPVAELLAERAPVTLRSVAFGLLLGWLLGFTLALPAAMSRGWAYDFCTTIVSGLFLCLPSAVLGLGILYFGGPIPLAVALVVFPRIFRYCRNLILQTYSLPHVLTALAKGLTGRRILLWHVLPVAAPPVLALVGVSVSMAFGATIPIEVICDSPGIGQLAWQAALGRDIPVLVIMTLLVALITVMANSISDLAGKAFRKELA